MSDNVAVAWNQAALEAVRQARMGPPLVARVLHVLHASMYDAWAAHDDMAFGSRLGDELRRPPAGRTQEAKREAASFAAHRALADLFPAQADAFAKLIPELETMWASVLQRNAARTNPIQVQPNVNTQVAPPPSRRPVGEVYRTQGE